MSKGKFVGDEGVVDLRGVVRGGKLVGLLDHEGRDIGMPLTGQTSVTGGISIYGMVVVPDLVAESSSEASNNSVKIQNAISTKGKIIVAGKGIYPISKPLLIGSDTELHIASGVVIQGAAGTYGNVMIRASNAELTGNILLANVSIVCADEGLSGNGSLSYVKAGNLLSYKAPGDTAYGTAVDISVAGKYKISSSGGAAIYIICASSYFPASSVIQDVILAPVTGAVSATASRTANVVTVVESGHTRKTGDFIEILPGSGTFSSLAEISSVSDTGYTYTQTAADLTSTAIRVFGTSNISISGEGTIDYNAVNRTQVLGNSRNSIAFYTSSRLRISGSVKSHNASKYAWYLANVADVVATPGSIHSLSDGFHINGPAKGLLIDGVTGKTDDNLMAIGTSDYQNQLYSYPAEGSNVSNVTLKNLTPINALEALRIYGTAGTQVQNVTVENVGGYISGSANQVISLFEDPTIYGGGGVALKNISISDVTSTAPAGSTNYTVRVSCSGGISGLRLNNIKPSNLLTGTGAVRVTTSVEDITIDGVSYEGDWPTQNLLDILTGCTLNSLRISNVNLIGNPALQPCLVYVNAGATIKEVALTDINLYSTGAAWRAVRNYGTINNVRITSGRVDGSNTLFRNEAGANSTVNVSIDNIHYPTGNNSYPVSQDVACASVSFSNISGTSVRMLNAGNASGTTKIRAYNIGGWSVTSHLNTAPGGIYDVSGHEIRVDVADGKIARVDGNIVYNTKAAAGTLGAAGVVVCQGTAVNSWRLAGDPTLKY